MNGWRWVRAVCTPAGRWRVCKRGLYGASKAYTSREVSRIIVAGLRAEQKLLKQLCAVVRAVSGCFGEAHVELVGHLGVEQEEGARAVHRTSRVATRAVHRSARAAPLPPRCLRPLRRPLVAPPRTERI